MWLTRRVSEFLITALFVSAAAIGLFALWGPERTDQVVRRPTAVKPRTFEIRSVPVLAEDFNSYPVSSDAASLLANEGWTFGAGGAWTIARSNTPTQYPLGVPAYMGNVLLQGENRSGYASFGEESWGDYSVECTLGRAASDNDEIRVWVRANDVHVLTPSRGNGYMFFLNGGGPPRVHQTRGDNQLPPGTRHIGLSRWDAGKEFVLISDIDNPLPQNPSNLSAGDLRTWAIENGNGFSPGAGIRGTAEFFRVRFEVQSDRLTLFVSPKNPRDPLKALVPSAVGLGPGQVLKLEIRDGTYARGCFALETESQIAWFDDIRIDRLINRIDRLIK
jgi:hypothetical protein